MVFANQVYISATNSDKPDERMLRFMAVVILTTLCLLHYFSARMGRAVNNLFAASKLVMLSILFIAGAIKATNANVHDFNQDDRATRPSSSSAATAFLAILYSYQGWENATFVRDIILYFYGFPSGNSSKLIVNR